MSRLPHLLDSRLTDGSKGVDKVPLNNPYLFTAWDLDAPSVVCLIRQPNPFKGFLLKEKIQGIYAFSKGKKVKLFLCLTMP
jgi:hypothetical protein